MKNGRHSKTNNGARNAGHSNGRTRTLHPVVMQGRNGWSEYVLITGGCGFVGSNVADRLLQNGERVLLYDNLSRAGTHQNFEWLRSRHAGRVRLDANDTRDAESLTTAVAGATAVFHFAAQVAVTTSVDNPTDDFGVNAAGTLNVLEALRARREPPPLFFTSTNKVYGRLAGIAVQKRGQRYEPADDALRARGIDEHQCLEFCSPYGCSKGAADQYVLDYARTYGLQAIVFRMSCIYGPRQFGTEDQGWVAHFLLRALHGEAITIFGDGKQTRDLLFVDDLVEAFLCAREKIGELSGRVFNIGGGPANAGSLIEVIDLIAELEGREPAIEWGDWRAGDQRYYVSNTARFRNLTGWCPRVDVASGVRRLHAWLRASQESMAVAT
jgi:CDP-paratose 2-epimerase